MNSNSQLLVFLNKFNQSLHFLKEYTDLRNLWMTTINLWNSNERKLFCYLRLNKSKSIDYFESESLRTHIISRVSDPSKQISLNLSDNNEITDVSRLGNVHTLNLSGCKGVTDVSSLGNLHTLDLSYCDGITDVNSLGNLHTLNLSGCRGITDVSSLGNVHTLISWGVAV